LPRCRSTERFVFDQDGTLYPSGSHLGVAVRQRTKDWLGRRLRISRAQVELLYEDLQSKYPNPFHGFQSLGASVSEYHSEVFDAIDPCDYLTYDAGLVQVLLQLPQPKCVVTLASPSYSEALQACLGVKDLIEMTYYVKECAPDYSKKRCYRAIALANLGGDCATLCVVGDNFDLDIAPALELGCMAVHVSDKPVSGTHKTIPTIYHLQDAIQQGGR